MDPRRGGRELAQVSEIEILGRDKLIARLVQLRTGVEGRALTGIRKVIYKIKDDARDYIQRRAYDTGALHRSVRVQTTAIPAGNIVQMGLSAGGYETNPKTGRVVDYAIYVHEGTRRMRSRPFLEYAINLNKDSLVDALKEEMFKSE